MFWTGWSYLYFLSFACDCIWCLPWVYWALAVLCVPGLCPWCGISAVWFGESLSGVLLVVAPFSCHFRVAKVTSVKNLGVWDPNISAIRQQTRRGSRIVFWHFRNLILLYSQMLVFCVFHFWTAAVKSWCRSICLDVVFTILLRVTNFYICLAWNWI